jgi:hypothetical protein
MNIFYHFRIFASAPSFAATDYFQDLDSSKPLTVMAILITFQRWHCVN